MSQHFISRSDAEGDLLSCAAYIAESISSGEEHAEAITAVIRRFLAKGNVDLSAELANSVDDPFTRDRLLIAVAEKCVEIDDSEYALQLAEAVEDHGFQAQAYERIGLAEAAKGNFESACDAAILMLHPDSVMAGIAVAQSAAGEDEAVNLTIREIEFPTSAVSALIAIAASKAKTDSDRAVGALNSSLEKAAEIEHDEERIRAFCDIGNLFVEIGKKSNAVEAFEQARAEAEQLTNIHRDAFLAQTAIGFLHAGSEELADRTLDSVADKTQIASVVLAFARDHLQKEEKIEAVETLEEAYEILRSQKESETRDSKAKFALFAQIASQFAGAENFNRGIEIADSILIDEHRTNALTQIARIATAQNKDEFAREALGLLHDNAQKMIALIGMSDVVSESDAARASALLDEAIDGSKDVAQTGLRTELLAAIAGRFLSLGNSERSHSIVSMVLDILPDVRNSKTAVSTLVELSATVETGGIQLDDDDKQKIRSLLSPGHG